VGIPFEERWKRLDEAVAVIRALLDRSGQTFDGTYYSTEGIALEPYSREAGAPPIWIGSWGSPAGLRRVARLGDGWLASAFNVDPDGFGDALDHLGAYLTRAGKKPNAFPNAIATMFSYVTENGRDAERVLTDVIAPALNRPAEELAGRLLVGPADECAERLSAFKAAGAQNVYLWPVSDEIRQLHVFKERVEPLLTV
jgi:alkanesulfonate monooxygenase SsuD/methylene tetrahydromethanopterin reductase-like flavin-dependent oxidoreductase (luciferase family)